MTMETQLVVPHISSPTFGPIMETRLLCVRERIKAGMRGVLSALKESPAGEEGSLDLRQSGIPHDRERPHSLAAAVTDLEFEFAFPAFKLALLDVSFNTFLFPPCLLQVHCIIVFALML